MYIQKKDTRPDWFVLTLGCYNHFCCWLVKAFQINTISYTCAYQKPSGRLSCHFRKHSQTIFAVKFPIKMLIASTCRTDFFCENMAASNFCDDKKSALSLALVIIWLHIFVKTCLRVISAMTKNPPLVLLLLLFGYTFL